MGKQINRYFSKQQITLIGGVGSGASTIGLARGLMEKNHLQLIGVQPFGSISFGSEKLSDKGAFTTGLGTPVIFKNIDHQYYNKIHWLSEDIGKQGSLALLKDTGIFAGLSSGFCYLVAKYEAIKNPERKILFIIADTGYRYFSSIYQECSNNPDTFDVTPVYISSHEQLQLPWCWMDWNNRSFQPKAMTA